MNEGCDPPGTTRPTPGGAPRRYFGKYAGVVVENAAPSGKAHRGQLKVRVPGILEEKPDGKSSRPLEVVAAPSFLPGFFFIPEKDRPVWVEFVAGDINYPIWTGVWYPDGDAPKDSAGSAPTEKVKVIRTAKGQVVHLDDTGGSEQTVIKDEHSGNTVTLDKHGVTIEATASGGAVTIKFGKSTVTIKDASVEIAHGQSKVTLDDTSLELKGPKDTLKMDAMGTTLANHGIVLGPIITWLLSHTHIGNMGAPTPLNPGQLAELTAKLGSGVDVVTKPGG
jgi:uncharacterized protein involved in type VI secretion and phage assembly